jgi:hypothetical protein
MSIVIRLDLFCLMFPLWPLLYTYRLGYSPPLNTPHYVPRFDQIFNSLVMLDENQKCVFVPSLSLATKIACVSIIPVNNVTYLKIVIEP